MKKESLYNFFGGLASDKEKEEIRQWLDADIANHQTLLNEREFFDVVTLANEKELEINRRSNFNLRQFAKQTMKWAAVIVVAFTSAFIFFSVKENSFENASNTISVPPGQHVNISLSDGTKVFLNAGSTFTYPSFFAKDKRNVELNGEAFFEVTPNGEKPFIVKTKYCDVEVLGTKFNVEAYHNENSFSTALMEGEVRIKNNLNPSNVIRLRPNLKTTLIAGQLSVSTITDYNIYKWKEGLICFENLNFNNLMKRLEKYYGVELIVENSTLAEHSFSGTFRMTDGVEHLLNVLKSEVSFQYRRSEDGNSIYIK